ncbi:MAG: hypothetical protein K5634_06095 [Sphaerochaetaceae bacterium]|nr:hypothetical protein [Sphaerochaetaceae bacterium]
MCLDDQILNTYLDGELEEPWKSQVEEHLSYCTSCKIRYNSLKKIKETVKSAALTQEEIQPHQDRVLAMIEKNYLNKPAKKKFLGKEIKFTVPQFMGVAAAFVIVFAGAFSLFGNREASSIPLPDVNNTINLEKITPVKGTEVTTQSKTLDDYTLDEILKYLDGKGYSVDIHLKSIQPIEQPAVAEPAPVEEAPVEEAPAEETPVIEEVTVVEEAPVVEVVETVEETPAVEEAQPAETVKE